MTKVWAQTELYKFFTRSLMNCAQTVLEPWGWQKGGGELSRTVIGQRKYGTCTVWGHSGSLYGRFIKRTEGGLWTDFARSVQKRYESAGTMGNSVSTSELRPSAASSRPSTDRPPSIASTDRSQDVMSRWHVKNCLDPLRPPTPTHVLQRSDTIV